MITITESAQTYLAELLSKQADALGVRVFINQPGTPRAETCIAYCREGDVKEGDVAHDYGNLKAWFEGRSLPFLDDALVDYASDRMGGQLTIKAPNAKMPRVDDDSPIEANHLPIILPSSRAITIYSISLVPMSSLPSTGLT